MIPMPPVSCIACERALPDGAPACPRCGAAAPTEGEVVLWRDRPSQNLAFTYYVTLVLLTIASMCILFVITFPLWIARRLRIHRTVYTLTSRRVCVCSGVFTRASETIELRQVLDVSVEQPRRLRIVGLATVNVLSADPAMAVLAIAGITGAAAVRDRIRELAAARQPSA